MKKHHFLLPLVLGSIFFSFTEKENTTTLPASANSHPARPAFYASGWETIADWTTGEGDGLKSFSYLRSSPELTTAALAGGAVVVYAKGYDFEAFSKGEPKPVSLPFYFMSTNEQLPYVYHWSTEAQNGTIKIALYMHPQLESAFQAAKEHIQLRYFILSKPFLQKNKMTPQTLRKTAYAQLIHMLQVAP